jgi:hypothetical protein
MYLSATMFLLHRACPGSTMGAGSRLDLHFMSVMQERQACTRKMDLFWVDPKNQNFS